ncbi:MAG: hypothetical protein Q9161_000584 [Pseudevernia consocians]
MVQHYWQKRLVRMEVTLANILSWTHDFSFTDPRDRIYALLGLAVDAQFDACASRSPEVSLQENTNVPSVLGAVIYSVSATTDACFENAEEWKLDTQETATSFLSWVSQAENLSEILRPYTATAEPLEEAIWRTLCTDHTANGIAPAPDYFGLCFRIWRYEAERRLSNTFESSNKEVTAPAMQSLQSEITKRVPESFKNQKASTDFGQVMASTSVRQRFCVTEYGHIGKVPVNARVGDRICILFGGPVPFLLRPLSETENIFELVETDWNSKNFEEMKQVRVRFHNRPKFDVVDDME